MYKGFSKGAGHPPYLTQGELCQVLAVEVENAQGIRQRLIFQKGCGKARDRNDPWRQFAQVFTEEMSYLNSRLLKRQFDLMEEYILWKCRAEF